MIKLYLFLIVDVALEREVEGSLILGDMGDGMPFRPGMFDGAIRWEQTSCDGELSVM